MNRRVESTPVPQDLRPLHLGDVGAGTKTVLPKTAAKSPTLGGKRETPREAEAHGAGPVQNRSTSQPDRRFFRATQETVVGMPAVLNQHRLTRRIPLPPAMCDEVPLPAHDSGAQGTAEIRCPRSRKRPRRGR